jgi:hypothetical protein
MWSLRCHRAARSGVQAGPVDGGEEALVEGEPDAVALAAAGLLRVGVDPVLEGVDAGHVGEEEDDRLELLTEGAAGGRRVVEGIEVIAGEQLHAHAGDLAELERRGAVPDQGLVGAGEGVEGVAALVQEGQEVVVAADERWRR